MKYSVHVKCPHGSRCPDLYRKDGSWNPRHGSAGFACRLPTSQGIKPFKRYGYESKADAKSAAETAGKLLDLAGADTLTRNKIGDMIAAAKRGAPLPALADVQRRLGRGVDPASPGITFGQAWAAWLRGKMRLRRSSRERLAQIGDHWLLPVLDGVPLERLDVQHCAEVFSRIEQINAGIIAQQGDGRAYVHVDGDVRTRPRLVSTATQHRVYAALREFCNFEMRKTRRLAFNPVFAVELEPEVTPEARRWSAAQAAAFLAASAGDPLHLLFRIVLLRGPRRSEADGLRWSGADLNAGYLTVQRPILLVGSDMHEEAGAKSRAGDRKIWLDETTVSLLREHRRAQLRDRMAAGEAWQDNDLIFCRPDGTPWRPDYVTRRFQSIARDAGLPVIKLHEGRHSAASLARDAAVDPEIRRKTLGHADAAMTSHYTHIEAAAHRAAAEAVAALVERSGS